MKTEELPIVDLIPPEEMSWRNHTTGHEIMGIHRQIESLMTVGTQDAEEEICYLQRRIDELMECLEVKVGVLEVEVSLIN